MPGNLSNMMWVRDHGYTSLDALAAELGEQDIRVNGVVIQDLQTEIEETVAFLLSPAAIGLQGELLYVDRGYVHLTRELDIST